MDDVRTVLGWLSMGGRREEVVVVAIWLGGTGKEGQKSRAVATVWRRVGDNGGD